MTPTLMKLIIKWLDGDKSIEILANATNEKQSIVTANGVGWEGGLLTQGSEGRPSEVVSRRPSKSRGRTERHLCSQIF